MGKHNIGIHKTQRQTWKSALSTVRGSASGLRGRVLRALCHSSARWSSARGKENESGQTIFDLTWSSSRQKKMSNSKSQKTSQTYTIFRGRFILSLLLVMFLLSHRFCCVSSSSFPSSLLSVFVSGCDSHRWGGASRHHCVSNLASPITVFWRSPFWDEHPKPVWWSRILVSTLEGGELDLQIFLALILSFYCLSQAPLFQCFWRLNSSTRGIRSIYQSLCRQTTAGHSKFVWSSAPRATCAQNLV